VPDGASGSSAIITSVLAVFGRPLHSKDGDTFTPSHVYWRGISSPSLKAVLVSLIEPAVVGGVEVDAEFCAETPGRVAQPATTSISNSKVIACNFLFTIDPDRKLIRRRRSWRRDRHPLLYDLNNVLMCHSQFENKFAAVGRNLCTLQENFFIMSLARSGPG